MGGGNRKLFNAFVHYPGQPAYPVSIRNAASGEYTIDKTDGIVDSTTLECEFSVWKSAAYVMKHDPLFGIRVTANESAGYIVVLCGGLGKEEKAPELPRTAVALKIQIRHWWDYRGVPRIDHPTR
jgi:hypothetical protein